MRSVLVIGAGGMAGHVVATFLSEVEGFNVATLSAHHRVNKETLLIDVMDRPSFEGYLDQHSFDVVVNCVGSLIQASEERKDRAVYLNTYLPHALEHRFSGTATKLIHLSTDCVFSGDDAPYREDSPPDGTLFYDRSKYLGEVVNQKDLTFRMSIVGPDSQAHGVGLFNWFFAQSGTIFGYTTAMWNGVTTITLARAIRAAIEQDLTGIYHLVPATNLSKFELLELFRQSFGRSDLTIQPREVIPVDKTLVNTRNDFDFAVPPYPDQIDEMRSWIEDHPALYPHYLNRLQGRP